MQGGERRDVSLGQRKLETGGVVSLQRGLQEATIGGGQRWIEFASSNGKGYCKNAAKCEELKRKSVERRRMWCPTRWKGAAQSLESCENGGAGGAAVLRGLRTDRLSSRDQT